MPRSILISHVMLLLSASLLLGAATTARIQGLADQRPLPDSWFVTLTTVAAVTAVVLFCSEWFTGIRWAGILAVVSAVAVLLGSFVWQFPDAVLLVLWFATWAAIAGWFSRMAMHARADR